MTRLISKLKVRHFFGVVILLSYFLTWPGQVSGWMWPVAFIESAPGYWAWAFVLFYMPPVFASLGLLSELGRRSLWLSPFRYYKWGSIGAIAIFLFFSNAFMDMGPLFFESHGLVLAILGYLGLFIFKGRTI